MSKYEIKKTMVIHARDLVVIACEGLQRDSLPVGMFEALFGCSPTLLAYVWKKLCRKKLLGANSLPIHLLWTMAFLKQYGTEAAMAAMFHTSRETYRQRIWDMLEAIWNLDEVSDNDRLHGTTFFSLNIMLSFFLLHRSS